MSSDLYFSNFYSIKNFNLACKFWSLIFVRLDKGVQISEAILNEYCILGHNEQVSLAFKISEYEQTLKEKIEFEVFL
jgi:hypothetical protein